MEEFIPDNYVYLIISFAKRSFDFSHCMRLFCFLFDNFSNAVLSVSKVLLYN